MLTIIRLFGIRLNVKIENDTSRLPLGLISEDRLETIATIGTHTL